MSRADISARGSRMRLAMGSFVTVRACAPDEAVLEAAMGAALETIGKFESSLHPFRPGSDIAAINAAEIGTRVSVAAATMRVLTLARDVFAASEQRFDPCLPTHSGRFSALELHGDHVIVREPICLDLGGIAKGFAADEGLAVLRSKGCIAGSVNVGGDIAAFGEAEIVALRRADQSLAQLELNNVGLAVTDTKVADRPSEHRGYYQRVAAPSPVRTYAAVVAPSAAIADALTKCALYCLDDELKPLLDRFNARLI